MIKQLLSNIGIFAQKLKVLNRPLHFLYAGDSPMEVERYFTAGFPFYSDLNTTKHEVNLIGKNHPNIYAFNSATAFNTY